MGMDWAGNEPPFDDDPRTRAPPVPRLRARDYVVAILACIFMWGLTEIAVFYISSGAPTSVIGIRYIFVLGTVLSFAAGIIVFFAAIAHARARGDAS